MSSEDISEEHSRPHPSRTFSGSVPRGILKNPITPSAASAEGQRLQWDEANIALTEIQKDSLMKIDEPKTPFVRYNAETDTVEGDIPNLDLYGRNIRDAPVTAEPALPSEPQSPNRRRLSFNSRDGSTSSRSTSFNLADSARNGIRAIQQEMTDEVHEDEEMDPEAAVKHAEFVRARGRHYSNEAEAMKRAQQMMEDEDDSEVPEDDDPMNHYPGPPALNGIKAST